MVLRGMWRAVCEKIEMTGLFDVSEGKLRSVSRSSQWTVEVVERGVGGRRTDSPTELCGNIAFLQRAQTVPFIMLIQ